MPEIAFRNPSALPTRITLVQCAGINFTGHLRLFQQGVAVHLE